MGDQGVAARLGERAPAASADAAYLHGMDLVLLASGIAALVTAPAAGALLPDPKPAGSAPGDHADLVTPTQNARQ
ncbi:hypothetical protein AAW14_28275 [Streptomyces hygroscopicus]|uniref:hypothetical protein n=1 Tax=Streptomyces hygroscopicus TaxID=1912 RepID=UPI002240BC4B|nr:hypothetical protein [Streptomyces hygroscopicus]MCW7945785.1 hypothetical protein [Streptomyces hygroscopicus]